MNKLTKVLSIFVLAGVIGTGVAGVAGCNNKKNSHTHSYTYTVDENDATKHNGTCKCGKDPKIGEGHVDTKDGDGVCDLCGAPVNPQSSTGEATVTGVTVSGAKSVPVEGNITLTATVAGTGNPAQTVTWSSSDESIATVDTNGKVTGVKEGPVTITATSTVDTTKKGEYAITVTAKGTEPGGEETGMYGTLVAKSNKIYNNDFTAAGTIGVHGGYGTVAGIYTDTENAVLIADGAVKHKEGVKGSDGTTGINTNIIVDFGPIAANGTIEGYMEVSVNDIGSSWNLMQFKNASGTTVFAVGADKDKKLSYVAGSSLTEKDAGGTTVNAAGTTAIDLTFAKDTVYKVYYKFDLSAGTVNLDISGKEISVENLEIESLVGIILPSGNKGARLVTVDNVVFCGDKMSTDDYKPAAKANLDKEYAKYILEDGEDENGTAISATHSTNKAVVTKAYEDGVAAIEAATTIDEVTEAYSAAVAAMKDVIADADIATEIEAAKTALAEKFPAANYSYDYAEGNDDATYNNKKAYEEAIAEIEGQIEGGATTKSNLDKIVADATLDVENNATKLAAKKTAATGDDSVIKTYKATETAAIETEHAEQFANIGDIRAQALTDIGNATTIDAINEIIEEAKKDIDKELLSTQATLEDLIASYQSDLEAVGAAEKAKVADEENKDDFEAAIEAAVTAGKTAIGEVTDKANVKAVYDVEEAKVKAAVTNLKNSTYTITVKKGDTTLNTFDIKYGTVVKKSDIKVLAKEVLTAKINNVDIPEEGVAISADTDVIVTLGDIAGFEASMEWRVSTAGNAEQTIIDNTLIKAEYTNAGATYVAQSKTVEGVDFDGAWKSENIAADSASGAVLTFTVKEKLASLTLYVALGDNSMSGRKGSINVQVKNADGTDKKTPVKTEVPSSKTFITYKEAITTGLESGDTIKIFISDITEGPRLYLFGVDAKLDDSNVEKEVSITWGSANEATLYHYYDVVNLPEDPVDPDGKTFIGWYYTPAGGTETKYEGGEKFPSGTTITLTPKFLSDNITLKFTVEGQDPVEEKFALNAGAKGVEPDIEDPAKTGYYFLGWQTSDGALVDFAQITPNADISEMKTLELTPKFAAHETLTSEQTVPNEKGLTFKTTANTSSATEFTAASGWKSYFYPNAGDNDEIAIGFGAKGNGKLQVKKNETQLTISAAKGGSDQTTYLTLKTTTANAVLKITFSGNNNGRYFIIKDAEGTAVGKLRDENGVVAETVGAKHSDSLSDVTGAFEQKEANGKEIVIETAGEYKIYFATAETGSGTADHKITGLSLIETTTGEITGVVQKITAETVEGETVVKAVMLYDKKEFTVTLTEEQYTEVDGKIIYGTGKTAADAHKYNSCPVPAAE